MSEHNNKVDESKIVKVDSPAGLSTEMLLKMLIKAQDDAAKANSQLAEALLESRKPYVDPAVIEQKRQAAEEKKRMIEMELRQRIAKKQQCPHLRDNGTLNIKWMEHSNGIIKGVCGTCWSEFDSRNPKDVELLRRDMKSLRNMGRAGIHTMTRVIGQA